MDWSVRHRTQQCYKLTIKSHIRRWTGISPVSFIPARYYRYPEYLEYELINHMRRYLFFFFLEEEKSIWSWSLFVPFYLEIKEHMIHWFTSLRGSLGILSRRCKIIGSSAKKKKNSEAVTGYILELYVYFTQSFRILCRRRLLILWELDVRDHF